MVALVIEIIDPNIFKVFVKKVDSLVFLKELKDALVTSQVILDSFALYLV